MAKDHSKDYSESSFWTKVRKNASSIGKRPLLDALKLFYAMKEGKATSSQVISIVAALGYLICPVDAVPDILGAAGYVDDAGVLSAAAAALSCCADPSVQRLAQQKLKEWFD